MVPSLSCAAGIMKSTVGLRGGDSIMWENGKHRIVHGGNCRSYPGLSTSRVLLHTRCILHRKSSVSVELDMSNKTTSRGIQSLEQVSIASATGGARRAMETTKQPRPPPARPGVKAWTKDKRLKAAIERMRSAQDMASVVSNAAEALLTLLEPAGQKLPVYAETEIQLADNFAPVTEECPPISGLEVTGTIPDCLNGVYVRNGSNPLFEPTGGYHIFDGDGMLHAIRIQDGVPSYCCRFTRTERYLQSKAAGHQLYPNTIGELTGLSGLSRMSLFYLRVALGMMDQRKGTGTANAGLVFYDGRLLAMSEDDLPYAISVSKDDGDLHTMGRYNIPALQPGQTMTAHPKVDPTTGDMFSYTYNLLTRPYLQYWHMSGDRKKHAAVTINLKQNVVLHDFAVTENYAVLADPLMSFRLSEMIAGRNVMHIDEHKVSRFGILPKYATDDSALRWFEVPGANCTHYVNAWEEGNEVVVLGSSSSPAPNVFKDISSCVGSLTEYRMNLQSGSVSQRKISDWNIDLGRINESFRGRKSRYTYICLYGPWPKFSGIVKIDLSAGIGKNAPAEVAVRALPPGCYCSEPFFVPRKADDGAASGEGVREGEGGGEGEGEGEDDGYLVSFLHNESTNVSELGIFDARSPTLEPVATIKLPARVPYGFHGIFISEHQLASQNSSPL